MWKIVDIALAVFGTSALTFSLFYLFDEKRGHISQLLMSTACLLFASVFVVEGIFSGNERAPFGFDKLGNSIWIFVLALFFLAWYNYKLYKKGKVSLISSDAIE